MKPTVCVYLLLLMNKYNDEFLMSTMANRERGQNLKGEEFNSPLFDAITEI